MSAPVVVTAVFHPVEGGYDALVAALHRSIPAVHDEPGCELYAIHDAPDGTIVMIEKWTTVADLDAHAIGEPVVALRDAIAGLVTRSAVVTRLEPLPVGDPERGAL
jgi:quinol monooxygenase YgiN